jgi:phosphoglycerate dehydrogenase-like enzyme
LAAAAEGWSISTLSQLLAAGIPVVNAPGRNAQAVIEFTLGLILAECRGIGRAHKALSDSLWQGHLYRYDVTGRELKGQTIGLVGFGAVAQGLVPYLRPFGMRILAFDPYVGAARCAELGVEQVDLPTLLTEADIVSIHARVTKETRGMIGPAQFAQMKRGAYFINTARGPLVDHDALYDALLSGHLAGAGLDTLCQRATAAQLAAAAPAQRHCHTAHCRRVEGIRRTGHRKRGGGHRSLSRRQAVGVVRQRRRAEAKHSVSRM